MEDSLTYAQNLGAEYAEITSIESERTIIEIENEDIKEISTGNSKGFTARVLCKGGLGTAYSYKPNYKELIKLAIKNAKTIKGNIKIAYRKPVKKIFNTKFKKNIKDYSLEEKKDSILKLYDLKKDFKKIINLNITYSDGTSQKSFINTEGTKLMWNDTSTGILAWAFSKQNNILENFARVERIKGGYEIMELAETVTKEAMEKATQLLKAKSAKGGHFDTIVNQKLGGVFAHEAIGHACEADLILTNSSILQNRQGQQIGTEKISISDDGSIENWGWTPFDAEGILGRKKELIKNGVLKNFLHNRETAKKFNAEPTGNGRNEVPFNKAIPRMTSTYIENGDSSFEEMLSLVKNGYYLKGSLGGQVHPANGEFLFNAQEGYLIKNHEICEMVKGVSLVGNILKTLYDILLIGKDLEFESGYCGKDGQLVPVSDGSPHILIKNAKIGGSN